MSRSEQHQEIARAGFLALLLSNAPVLSPAVLRRLRAAVEQPQQLAIPEENVNDDRS